MDDRKFLKMVEKMHGDRTLTIISCEEKEYIVALEADGLISFDHSDSYRKKLGSSFNDVMAVTAKAAKIRAKISPWLPDAIAKSVRVQLAQGVARAYCRDLESANQFIGTATDIVDQMDSARAKYLKTGLVVTVGLLALIAVFQMEKALLVGGLGSTPYLIATAALVGGIGSYFSIVTWFGNTRVSYGSINRLIYLECISSIAVGCLAGGIAGALVLLGIIGPAIKSDSGGNLFMFVLAFFAGTRERWIDSKLRAIGNKENS